MNDAFVPGTECRVNGEPWTILPFDDNKPTTLLLGREGLIMEVPMEDMFLFRKDEFEDE